METNKIPFRGRKKIMNDKARGVDKETIYEKYEKKYGKYFDSKGNIRRNIAAVMGHFTKGHKPRKK